MANSLGALVVSLGLDAAQFIDGLTKADYQAKKFADKMSNGVAVGIIKATITMEAFTAAARLAVSAFPDLIEKAGKFQDIAEITGESAEAMASFSTATAVANTTVDAVAGAMVKLSTNLTGVDDDSKAAGAAVKALGLNLKDFKALSPAAQIDTLSKSLEGFEESATKAAVARALLGKQGAELLPFLKELNAEGGRNVIITGDQIRMADDYADRNAKLRSELSQYAQVLAIGLIPTLNQVHEAFSQTSKDATAMEVASALLEGAAKAIVTVLQTVAIVGSDVGFVLLGIGRELGAIAAQGAALARLDFAGFTAISDAVKADGVRAKAELDKFQARVLAIGTRGPSDPTEAARFARQRDQANATAKKKLVFNGADENGAAALKKSLDGQVKLIRDFAEQQKAGYDFANTYLKGAYDDGLLALTDFYTRQDNIRKAGLQAQLDAFDKEIAALEVYKSKAAKPQDRIETKTKIAEATAKRAQAVLKAGQDGFIATQEEARGVKALNDQYNDLRATILGLQGDTAGAAAIRINKQVEDAKKLLTQAGQDPAGADRLKSLLTDTESLAQAQRDYGRIVDTNRNAEESALLDAQLGGKTEIETLRTIGGLRGEALTQLAALTVKAQDLAQALGTPEAKAFAENLALQFKKATAEADPLLLKIKDIGNEAGQSIASSFEDAIVEGKGLRDTLKGIESDLLRIVTRNLVTKPLGDYLSNIIGGNGASSGGGGFIGSILKTFGLGGGPDTSTLGTGDFSRMDRLSVPDFSDAVTRAGLEALIPGAKSGMDYVPYDNYLVRLHEGERVLTKTENRAWNSGFSSAASSGAMSIGARAGSGGGDTLIFQGGVGRGEVLAAMSRARAMATDDVYQSQRRRGPIT